MKQHSCTWCTWNYISDHAAQINELSKHNFIWKTCGSITKCENLCVCTKIYTANVCRELQGLCGGFLQYLHGKPCNIYRFSLQYLQSCKYYRVFPADISENPLQSPCNSLQTFAVYASKYPYIPCNGSLILKLLNV